jgi:hypothetical protein
MAVRALCPEAGEEVWDAEGRWGHVVEVWVTQEVHPFELYFLMRTDLLC